MPEEKIEYHTNNVQRLLRNKITVGHYFYPKDPTKGLTPLTNKRIFFIDLITDLSRLDLVINLNQVELFDASTFD